MVDRVKKSLWIITVIAAFLIPIICFIVTVGRAENVRFINPKALKELIEKKRAKLTLPFLFIPIVNPQSTLLALTVDK
jgi:hypothetical protein